MALLDKNRIYWYIEGNTYHIFRFLKYSIQGPEFSDWLEFAIETNKCLSRTKLIKLTNSPLGNLPMCSFIGAYDDYMVLDFLKNKEVGHVKL